MARLEGMGRRSVELALDAAANAVTLAELDESFLPLLEDALGASGSLLFEFGDDGQPRGVSGSLAPHILSYNATLFGQDPVQEAMRGPVPAGPTIDLDDVLPYERVRNSPAFQEFYRPLRAERILGVHPTGQRFGAPGMVGLMLGRPRSDRAFSARERRRFARVIPALRNVIARDRKARERDRERTYALAVLSASRRATFVLDRRGTIVFASPAAQELSRAEPQLPRALADAVVRRAHGPRTLATGHRAELVPARLDSGRAVVIAEVVRTGADAAEVHQVARAHGLTRAETSVLACLARGLDNRSIAAELHVSEATVKTHLRHVLGKLGVTSRTQAALRVHGIEPG